MPAERIGTLLRENAIPQVAVCHVVDITTFSFSSQLRGLAILSERTREDIENCVTAMLELTDESVCPPDWRQVAKMKPILQEKMAGYRAARSRELHQRFIAGQATAQKRVFPMIANGPPSATTKPIPFLLRDQLWEIKGILLSVWLSYFLHADRHGFAWPSVETVSLETGYSRTRICEAKAQLERQGWLKCAGQKRRAGAKFGLKEYLVLIPPDPHKRGQPRPQNVDTVPLDGDQVPLPQNVAKPRPQFVTKPRPQNVDTKVFHLKYYKRRVYSLSALSK